MPYSPSDFTIEKANADNLEEYLAFLDEFFCPREQMSVGLGIKPAEMTKYLRTRLPEWIAHETSVVAIHTSTNQLAGVSFTSILTRNDPITFDVKDVAEYSENFRILIHFVSKMEKEANLFRDPTVDKILEIASTATHPEFSGNRLTYRMAEESEKLAKAVGCQMVTSQSTNKITQHIRKKMGLEEVVRLDYETLEVDGKRVMDTSAQNGSTCALVLRKYL